MKEESKGQDQAQRQRRRDEEGEVTLELDGQDDLDGALRDAVAAVEEVESGGREQDAGGKSQQAGDEPGDEVGALRREIADLRDRSMRTLADFENYRKRAERERQEVRRYALLEPLRELLPVADNLERALSAEGSAEDLKRGVAMILRHLHDLLRGLGVREVPAAGAAFDPALHEAVLRQESSEVDQPTVAETLTHGYLLHDRLLRPAMVKVAVPAEGSAEKQPAAGGDSAAEQAEKAAGKST